MNADEIICEQLVELVTDYLDGALDPVVAARFDAHLLECDGCVNYLEQFRSTISTLGRVQPDQFDEGFRERLLDTFRGWTATPEHESDRPQHDT
jgi:anti-sigma factor RsiW